MSVLPHLFLRLDLNAPPRELVPTVLTFIRPVAGVCVEAESVSMMKSEEMRGDNHLPVRGSACVGKE